MVILNLEIKYDFLFHIAQEHFTTFLICQRIQTYLLF